MDAHDGIKLHHATAQLARLHSVQANAGANHIKMHRRIEHRGRRVGTVHDAALKTRVLNGLNGLGKALALQFVVPTRRLVGRGEVREYAVALNTAMETDAAHKVEHLRIVNADTIHARLDGQMVFTHLARRNGALTIGQGKIGRINRRHDVKLQQRRDSLNGRLAQDQDGLGDSTLSQLNTFVDRRHREHVGSGRVHDLGALDGTMAVGIGLDHATQALTRIEQVLISPRIAAKRPTVNLDPGPTRQIGLIHDYSSDPSSVIPRSSSASFAASSMAGPIRSIRSVAMTLFSPYSVAAAKPA